MFVYVIITDASLLAFRSDSMRLPSILPFWLPFYHLLVDFTAKVIRGGKFYHSGTILLK